MAKKMNTFNFNKSSKILIYGYGAIGRDLHQRLSYQGFQVIGIIDKNAETLKSNYSYNFLKPQELDLKHTGNIIIITMQNILEHERVVRMLVSKGFRRIVYLNRSRPETSQDCFRIYNQLIGGKKTSEFEFPVALVEQDYKPSSYCKAEQEAVVIDVPSSLIFTGIDSSSSPWQNLNIAASIEYNALFEILLNGRCDSLEEFRTYTDVLCGSDRTKQAYLDDRSLLIQMMRVEFMNNGLTFFRNAPPSAKWNQQGSYFNLIDGHHRASFLVNNHVYIIPVRISIEDYEHYFNSKITKKCQAYFENRQLKNTYTPIYHPAFHALKSLAEKDGSPATGALYKYFAGEDVSDMRVLDMNSNLSFFSQIFARMGAARIVSFEPRMDLFTLANLLNQLHYTDTIELYNEVFEDWYKEQNFEVVIMANDIVADLASEGEGKQLLQKIDALSSRYFIKRTYANNQEEFHAILNTSTFRSYQRLSIEIINGELSEVGIYEK
jgi:hypothetical protein